MRYLAPQVHPELLDWVERVRVWGEVEKLEAALLLSGELLDLPRVVGGGVVEAGIQDQFRVHLQEREEEGD